MFLFDPQKGYIVNEIMTASWCMQHYYIGFQVLRKTEPFLKIFMNNNVLPYLPLIVCACNYPDEILPLFSFSISSFTHFLIIEGLESNKRSEKMHL